MRETDQIVADNRKARHDFHVLETFEAGVALLGTLAVVWILDRKPMPGRVPEVWRVAKPAARS